MAEKKSCALSKLSGCLRVGFEEWSEVVCGFTGDDVISGLIGVAVGEPTGEVTEQSVEAIILDDDGGVIAWADEWTGERLEICGDAGEGVAAVVEHVAAFFEFLGVGGIDVEHVEFFLFCDGSHEVIDFGGGFGVEVGDDGHGDDGRVGMILAQFCDEGVKVGGEVGGEILSARAVVQSVPDVDEVGGGFGFHLTFVATGGEQSLDIFAAEAEVMDIDGGQACFLGEQDADDVLELGFLGGELFGDDGLGGAVAEEEDLSPFWSVGGVGELEGLSSDELVGGDGGADVAFGVFDEQFGAALMADVGPRTRVVHAIGQVADQDDVPTVFGHLSEAEGAAGDAHIDMDSGEHDVLDAFAFEEIPYLGS